MYLHPPKSDATISWKPIKDSVWQVYTDALEVNVPIMQRPSVSVIGTVRY